MQTESEREEMESNAVKEERRASRMSPLDCLSHPNILGMGGASRRKRNGAVLMCSETGSQCAWAGVLGVGHSSSSLGEVQWVVSASCNFAKSVSSDHERRRLLRLKCFSKLKMKQRSGFPACEKALLDRLRSAVRDIDNALLYPKTCAKLDHTEHVLLDLMSTAASASNIILTSSGMPLSYLAASAHLYSALLCRIKKEPRKVATHLLAIFSLCPGYGRCDLALELWEDLFRPHFMLIDSWYKRECAAIISSAKTAASIMKPPPISPLLEGDKNTDHHQQVVPKEATHNNQKQDGVLISDKLAQLDLLNSLREEVLDESTQLYADYYQSLLLHAVEAKSSHQLPEGRTSNKLWSPCSSRRSSLTMNGSYESSTSFPPPDDQLQNGTRVTVGSEEWQGFEVAPVRKSLLEAVLGIPFFKVNQSASHDIQLTATTGDTIRQDQENASVGPSTSFQEPQLQTAEKEGLKLMADVFRDSHQKVPASPLYCQYDMDANNLDVCEVEKRVNTYASSNGPSCCTNVVVKPEDQKSNLEWSHCREGMSAKSDRFSIKSTELSGSMRYLLSKSVPEDFICGLTRDIFEDPVTLETGHTYERVAIQKWLDGGNTTCPTSGKTLSSLNVPVTNHVLKSLIEKWKEERQETTVPKGLKDKQILCSEELVEKARMIKTGSQSGLTMADHSSLNMSLSQNSVENRCAFPSRNPASFLESKSVEKNLQDLKLALSAFCGRQSLNKDEQVLLKIAKIWTESKGHFLVESLLLEVKVYSKIIDVMLRSKMDYVLMASVCIITSLVNRDESVKQYILQAPAVLDTLVKEAKKGKLPEIILLLHYLNLSTDLLDSLKIMPLLVNMVVKMNEIRNTRTVSSPLQDTQAIRLLMQRMVSSFDNDKNHENCKCIISLGGIPSLLDLLDSDSLEERLFSASVLIRCMRADGNCRNFIASNLKVASILMLLHGNSNNSIITVIIFLTEVLRLNRRPRIISILKRIREEGSINSMHALMVFLQSSPTKYHPLAASLLLHLDLLQVKPHRFSVFREEALDALVTCLGYEEDENVQAEAAGTLSSIGCLYSHSGDSLVEKWLMNKAGITTELQLSKELESSNSIADILNMAEEDENENACEEEWGRNIGAAVMAHGQPLVRALVKGLQSMHTEVARASLIASAWLSCFVHEESSLRKVAEQEMHAQLLKMMMESHERDKVFAAIALRNLSSSSMLQRILQVPLL